jgi:hypothetical protein
MLCACLELGPQTSRSCLHVYLTASEAAVRDRIKAYLSDPDSFSEVSESQQASRSETPSSQDAVRHLLVPPDAPGSESGPSHGARKLLKEIARHSRVAIRCGEDKLSLAATLYDSVGDIHRSFLSEY